ncbi:MAG TPA: hypothetical protein VEF04_01915 [Blastocatellia bacterium]|nr:hypothetical protein [Blastocatellia bacterium]
MSEKLARTVGAEDLFKSLFADSDLWSPKANYCYVEYLKQVKNLVGQKKVASELLARLSASREVMAVLAGAILQIAAQALIFRFEQKTELPKARRIGSQSVVDMIWEGHHQALACEMPMPSV